MLISPPIYDLGTLENTLWASEYTTRINETLNLFRAIAIRGREKTQLLATYSTGTG